MSKYAIIHIGMHKTGTSAIQQYLKNVCDDNYVYAKLGVANHSLFMYSIFANNPEKHHLLNRYDSESLSELKKNNTNLLSNVLKSSDSKILIFSGEGISRLTKQELFSMKAFMEKYNIDTKIIAYVRPPASYMTSEFQENVKAGTVNSFDIFSNFRSYKETFEKFDEVWGEDKVELYKYDRSLLYNSCVVQDICKKLGIVYSIHNKINTNDSIVLESVKLLYIYSKYGRKLNNFAMSAPESMAFDSMVRNWNKNKFRLAPSLLMSVLSAQENDICWMENRLGCSLAEELGADFIDDISSESDLLKVDNEVLTRLVEQNGNLVNADLLADDYRGIAQLIHDTLWCQAKPKKDLKNDRILTQKVLYIHVGKTAGTSLNAFLLGHYPQGKGVVHIENLPAWSDPTKKAELLNYDFISGHISLPAFRTKVDASGYLVLATFRNPLEHIASHLVWLKNMCSPGNESFLAGHPEWVQEIARKLWNVDFSSNQQIASFLSQMSPMETALLDNSQSRYMLSIPGTQKVDNTTLASALSTLHTVDLVGTTEHYDEFIALLCTTMNWQLPGRVEKHNVAQTKFGINILSDGFAEAVESVIWADRKLYEAALKKMSQQVYTRLMGLSPGGLKQVTTATVQLSGGPIIGSLDATTPNRISGWIMLTKRPDVPLVVRLTSKRTGHVWLRCADMIRNDLREKGLHPTGACGFIFALDGDDVLAEGDEITVSALWFSKIWNATVALK